MFYEDWAAQGIWNLLLALALALAAIIIVRWRRLKLEREVTVGGLRALIQMLAMGLVLVAVFNAGPLFSVLGAGADLWLSLAVLFVMGFVGALTSARRARPLPEPLLPCAAGVVLGPGLILLFMVAAGGLQLEARWLIPVGGMTIGNGMIINGLALERLRAEVNSQKPQIEAALALGATGAQALAEPLRTTLKAALIPSLDNLKTLGLVWIPGTMTGMLLAGSDPVWAATFQLLIMVMILASGLASAVTTTTLMGRRLFTPREQLVDFGGKES